MLLVVKKGEEAPLWSLRTLPEALTAKRGRVDEILDTAHRGIRTDAARKDEHFLFIARFPLEVTRFPVKAATDDDPRFRWAPYLTLLDVILKSCD